MKRRFVIGVDALDEDQESRFRAYIATKGSWWHWINNFWLVTTNDDDVTTSEIRDEILKLKPTARTVVFEFPEDITWSASGNRNASGKKLADWLKDQWKRPS